MWATGIIHGVSTNYCSILQNALVFLLKPKQQQKNRKQKQIKEGRPLGHLPGPTWPNSSWRPSPPPLPPPCRLPPRAGRQRRDTAHAPELATPPPCSSASPGHRDAARHLLGAAPTPWTPSLSPSPLFLSSASSLSLARAQPQPRHRNAAATVSPSTPRCACELRLDPLFLPTDPRPSGSPASPPTLPFPSSATGGRRRSIHRRQVAPEPTETRSATTVSSWVDSPFSPARVLALAPFPTSAEARRRHGRRAPCS